ncbi:MAG: dihydrodipicolinate synthase family protein [Chloroflexi bacterium]|nr:dihydrodipicolinate synthase family protein [Chloroflexota bacterium]
MAGVLRGYFAIALTPFNEKGDLLWDELADEFDWIVRAGAHGVVWPVNNSEQMVLSASERIKGYEVMVQAVAGRIPTMAGVADTSKAGALELTEAAAKAGVDATIAVPPWSVKMSDPALIEDFYRDVADVGGVPMCIQNLGGQMGSNLTSAFVAELCERISLAEYVKEERDPHGTWVSELIGLNSPAIRGVFTGGHRLGMVASYKRGACGCIASADMTDICAQIWERMEAGDEEGARRIQDAEAVLRRAMGDIPYLANLKEVLVRRGVFSSNSRRSLGPYKLDASHAEELEHGLQALAPYFRL